MCVARESSATIIFYIKFNVNETTIELSTIIAFDWRLYSWVASDFCLCLRKVIVHIIIILVTLVNYWRFGTKWDRVNILLYRPGYQLRNPSWTLSPSLALSFKGAMILPITIKRVIRLQLNWIWSIPCERLVISESRKKTLDVHLKIEFEKEPIKNQLKDNG